MKRITFFKSLLLAAGLMVGANGLNAETVGDEGNTTDYLGAHSTVQTIADGGSMHYVFSQTKATDANYKGWLLWVGSTGAEVTWANGISIVRGDNWDDRWPTGTDADNNPTYGSNAGCSSNFNWDNFSTQMNGATVDMTVSYSSGSLTMTSTITASDDTEFSYNYTKTVDGTPASIDVCLSVNKAYLNITTAEYTAVITGLPTTYTTAFTSTSTAPFIGGEIVVDNNNGNLLRVVAAKNQTATAVAYFDSDTSTGGNQAYSLSDGEEVTISFTAYHGYYNYSETNKFAVINSEGDELVSYAYDPNPCTVTDVKIGGTTVEGFESFGAASAYNATQSCNGFNDSKKPYTNQSGYNPVITIKISKDGTVKINFAQSFKSLDKTYSKTLSNVKMDLANLTITNSISGRDNNSSRVPGFGNFTISSATVDKATVTFKYEDTEGNSLATLVSDKTSTETTGTSISSVITSSLTTSFYNGDNSVRYDYKEFACSDETVPAAGTTVTLKFEAKAKVDYTVNAVNGNNEQLAELAKVSGYIGDNLSMAWSKYIEVGGQWYVTSENTFAIDASQSGTKNVTYNVSDIAYFFEMEKLSRTGGAFLTETNSSYSNNQRLRFSRGSTHYTPALAGGVYTLIIPCANSNNNDGDVKVYTRSNSGEMSEVLHTHTVPKGTNTLSYVITVPDGYSVAFNGSEGEYNNAARLDYMTLTPYKVSVPVSNGYATYANHDYALDFSNVEGLKAYTATLKDANTVTFTPATQVPAGTGLLLKGATADVPAIASAAAIDDNVLYAPTTAVSDLTYDDGTYYNYILTSKNNKVGFYQANSNTVAVGKAYIRVTKGSQARELTFIGFDDDNTTTGIDNVNVNLNDNNVFDLQGRRVNQPVKGMYIVNGKKVIFK